ncbi:MAG: hypothetical protein ACFE9L_06610 [Candidatus Hodarchaeota archaeon]
MTSTNSLGTPLEAEQMLERCKTLEENATALELEKPISAFELYKRAAKCFEQNNKMKNGIKCLEKAANVLKNLKSEDEDIFKTLEKYNSVSEIYMQFGKESELEKLMKNVYKQFISLTKTIREEVKNIDDPYAVESRLTLASAYAKAAKDNNLRNACWVDLGDKFRKKAVNISNPRQAFEVYNQAAKIFLKGENEKLKNEMLIEAAKNFATRGQQIEKSKKDLILAIDNYRQAAILNTAATNEKDTNIMNRKAEELCELIGLPLDHIINYLENELGLEKVSLNTYED